MIYRHLRGTDLEVSELGLGCARIGGVFQKNTEQQLVSLLRSAFDAGINFYDTADIYAQGESERLLGRAFHSIRDKVLIASKVGYLLPPQRQLVDRLKPLVRPLIRTLRARSGVSAGLLRGGLVQDFTSSYIGAALKRSLTRLDTDYLDLYLLHGLPQENREEAIGALMDLKTQGLIRNYGVSCESQGELEYCLADGCIPVLQVNYSVLHQEAAPSLKDAKRKVGVIGRQCYASGLLARPSSQSNFSNQPPERLKQVQWLEHIASQFGRQLPEMALKFASAAERVDVTLVGASSQQHLTDALSFHKAPALTESELTTLSCPSQ